MIVWSDLTTDDLLSSVLSEPSRPLTDAELLVVANCVRLTVMRQLQSPESGLSREELEDWCVSLASEVYSLKPEQQRQLRALLAEAEQLCFAL